MDPTSVWGRREERGETLRQRAVKRAAICTNGSRAASAISEFITCNRNPVTCSGSRLAAGHTLARALVWPVVWSAVDGLLPGSQMAREPATGQRGDLLQRARLLEEMGRAGDKHQLLLHVKLRQRGTVQLDHR